MTRSPDPVPPLPDETLGPAEPWRDLRRRIFLAVAPLAAGAALFGVYIQQPDVNPLDAVMLPMIALALLALWGLSLLRRVRVELAFAVLYLLFASYFVLMLWEQYRINVGPWQHLSDANYWYAALYCLAFLAWDTRRAAYITGGTYLLTLLAALLALPQLRAQGQLTVGLAATMLQFYLASLVVAALLTGFAVLKERTQQLRLMAYMDFLTGLPNRRHAEALLARLDPARRLSLVMLDVDHFKRVNDRFGHHTGDHVLREIGAVAGRHLRPDWRLARWGGEEFLLLLPGLDASEAYAVSERVRQAIERHPFDEAGHVTASLGVAERRPGEDLAATLRRADAALYQAKRGGRNRCALAEQDTLADMLVG